MYDPKEFFDMLMSPFILQRILDFSFQGGQACKQGADFLKTFFFNMFVASPLDALQDVMEINFGFEVTSIAGKEVDSKPAEEEKKGEPEADTNGDGGKDKEPSSESKGTEFSAM